MRAPKVTVHHITVDASQWRACTCPCHDYRVFHLGADAPRGRIFCRIAKAGRKLAAAWARR